MGVKVRKRKETYLYLAVGLLILLISSSLAVAAFGGEFEDAVAAYERGDYATAYRLFKPMAEQGHAEAQYNLGGMYAEGRGVPQDYGKAVKWFRKAAEQGHAEAQYNLGGMYFGGRGVQPFDFEGPCIRRGDTGGYRNNHRSCRLQDDPLPDRRGATVGTGVETEEGGEVDGRLQAG
jgi:TPR repeat protein